MRAWMARHIFYPAQDRLNGRSSLSWAAQLEASQWQDPQAIARLQLDGVRGVLAHAATNTPYYARLLAEAGVEPQALLRLEDLSRVPVLTREQVREAHADLLARGVAAPCAPDLDLRFQRLAAGLVHRCPAPDLGCRRAAARHRWFGVEPGDPAVYLWGSTPKYGLFARVQELRDWLINETLLNAFEMSQARMQIYADRIHMIQPRYLYAYASALWRLARFVRECRPELQGAVRATAFATGEQLMPAWREDIISSLGCSVADEYGTQEAGLIAHECPAGAHHITAEHVVVEILDHANRPVAEGQEGRIVVTNLVARTMPFIRYDTGDRGALRPGVCSCGRGLPMMERPGGRAHEFLETTEGVPVTARCVSRDFADLQGVAQYRVVQEAPRKVRVLLVPSSAGHELDLEADVRARMRRILGAPVEVVVQRVVEVPPQPSGKCPYIVNAMKQSR